MFWVITVYAFWKTLPYVNLYFMCWVACTFILEKIWTGQFLRFSYVVCSIELSSPLLDFPLLFSMRFLRLFLLLWLIKWQTQWRILKIWIWSWARLRVLGTTGHKLDVWSLRFWIRVLSVSYFEKTSKLAEVMRKAPWCFDDNLVLKIFEPVLVTGDHC